MTNEKIVEAIQGACVRILPAIKHAEAGTVIVGGETVEIPQQVQARLKQKVTDLKGELRDLVNQIQV